MSDIAVEIEKAIRALGLSSQVKRLPSPEERQLYAELIAEFLGGKNRRWWWEGFIKPAASISFADDMGFRYVPGLVPSAKESCWFMIEDSDAKTFPIYEATPELASQVIGERFFCEYYLIAKDKRWLICENHHGVVIGVGSEVVAAIQKAPHNNSFKPTPKIGAA